MMGQVEPQEQLLYRLRLEDCIPEDRLLRHVDQLVDLTALRNELAPLYSHTGRPSIDPELMIRMLLVGYLYGIRSETSLCQEVHLNLAYRWFCRLGLEGKVPQRSTFSKNRHGRFADGDVMRRVFDLVVGACADNGLIGGTGALVPSRGLPANHCRAVDGSTVHADANRARKAAPTEVEAIWAASDSVSRPVQDYLDRLEDSANLVPGPKHKPPKYLSETDPQAGWSLKDGPGRFSYECLTSALMGPNRAI